MNISARYPSRFVPLLVEDDSDHAYLIMRAFEEANVALSLPILRSGEEAVDYLSGNGAYQDRSRYPLPSVVILDAALPVRSGLDVLRWIRNDSPVRRLPVVMLTGGNDPDHVTKAYQLGVNSYLTKPDGSRGLVDLIKNLALLWGQLGVAPGLASNHPPAR